MPNWWQVTAPRILPTWLCMYLYIYMYILTYIFGGVCAYMYTHVPTSGGRRRQESCQRGYLCICMYTHMYLHVGMCAYMYFLVAGDGAKSLADMAMW